MVRGSGIICWLILYFRDDSVFLFRDRGNRFFGCRGGGRGELYLGGGGAAPDWRLNPGGHAQFGPLEDLGFPFVSIKVKKDKTEETK